MKPAAWTRDHKGIVKKKVDPCPSADSTQIRPRYRSTIRWQIANPMPVPEFGGRVRLQVHVARHQIRIEQRVYGADSFVAAKDFSDLSFGEQTAVRSLQMKNLCAVA